MNFSDIPKFPAAHYEVDVGWQYIEGHLAGWQRDWRLNLDPDFQRGHVWSREQQIAYVEYVLRGGEVAKNITFNAPGWDDLRTDKEMVLVDGKQRLEAARAFMRGDLPAFGRVVSEFSGIPRHYVGFKFRVCNLTTREEELQLYLNINAGGTPHTTEEIARVRALLEAARLHKSEAAAT